MSTSVSFLFPCPPSKIHSLKIWDDREDQGKQHEEYRFDRDYGDRENRSPVRSFRDSSVWALLTSMRDWKGRGCTITWLFASRGEEYFRRGWSLDHTTVLSIQGAVISTGGGAVLKEENIKTLQTTGVIFCLTDRPSDNTAAYWWSWQPAPSAVCRQKSAHNWAALNNGNHCMRSRDHDRHRGQDAITSGWGDYRKGVMDKIRVELGERS